MKVLRTIAIALMFAFVASSAFAAGNATLTVTADVLPTCSFTTAGTTMAFGSIDPTAIVDATASATIDYNCTSGLVYTFTNPATATINNPAPDSMTVDLVYADGSATPGTGTGANETLTIDGTITVANFTGKSVGAYTGTATLQINP